MLEKPEAVDTAVAEASLTLKVWLFGGLSTIIPDRPATLAVAPNFTAMDVISELGNRYGSDFLDQVMETENEKTKCCKIFVDGLPVEDIHWPVETEGEQAEFEMILLAADEGG